MTPSFGPRSRRRWSIALLVGASAALAWLIVSASGDGLVFYRTPTEALGEPRQQGSLRVGGLVVEGSVVHDDAISTLVLTDGAADVEVRYHGALPALVQEGEGAVVEGEWGAGDVIDATEILLRHSNEYQPVESEPRP